jgi:anaerobic ribonucleoside-triphosphate reductase activating protein
MRPSSIRPGSIRLSRVHFPVTALGPGTRLGIWVQGCQLACPGCMSRDTWDAVGGSRESIDGLAGLWRKARAQGATGLTVSGGEPAEQAAEVAELVHRIRRADAALIQDGRPQNARAGAQRPAPLDVLVFSGLDEEQFRAACPALPECADAAMLGRFDITQPTDLIWRGSGNQRLVTFTALGAERYAPYLQAATASPAIQFVVDADRIETIGIPRIGDLPALERRLREHGVKAGGVSWRP